MTQNNKHELIVFSPSRIPHCLPLYSPESLHSRLQEFIDWKRNPLFYELTHTALTEGCCILSCLSLSCSMRVITGPSDIVFERASIHSDPRVLVKSCLLGRNTSARTSIYSHEHQRLPRACLSHVRILFLIAHHFKKFSFLSWDFSTGYSTPKVKFFYWGNINIPFTDS